MKSKYILIVSLFFSFNNFTFDLKEKVIKYMPKAAAITSFAVANKDAILNLFSLTRGYFTNDQIIASMNNMPLEIENWCKQILDKHKINFKDIQFKVDKNSPSNWYTIRGLKSKAIVMSRHGMGVLKKAIDKTNNWDDFNSKEMALTYHEHNLLHEYKHLLTNDSLRYIVFILVSSCAVHLTGNVITNKLFSKDIKTISDSLKISFGLNIVGILKLMLNRLAGDLFQKNIEFQAEKFGFSKLNNEQKKLLLQHYQQSLNNFLEYLDNPYYILDNPKFNDAFKNFYICLHSFYLGKKSKVKFSEWINASELSMLEYFHDREHPSHTKVIDYLKKDIEKAMA